MSGFAPAGYFADLWILCVIVVPVYAVTRSVALREVLLFLVGVVVVFHLVPRLVPLYFLYWACIWGLQRLVTATRESRWAGGVFTIVLLLALAPMLSWKWNPTQFMPWLAAFGHGILEKAWHDLAFVDAHRSLLLPVGLSVATFRALDLLVQTFLVAVDGVRLRRVLAYGFCPFLVPIGPITTFQEFAPERPVRGVDVSYGLYRIATGLVKIFLLAAAIEPWSGVFRSFDRPPAEVIAAVYIFAFYVYFNFAGYSDLAIGTGRLFGMVLPENFRFPLIAPNPQQFWSRWHASLSRFAQRYIFMSLGGVRPGRRAAALVATIMVIALWHEFTLNYVLYGLYHSAALVAHDAWSRNRPRLVEAAADSLWYSLLCRFLLCSWVAFGFPIIMLPPGQILHFYGRLLPW